MSQSSRATMAAVTVFLVVMASPPAPPAQTREARADLTILKNVTLVDGTGVGPRENCSISVSGRLITKVACGTDDTPPAGAQVLDLSDHFVIPGLINGHVHLTGYPDEPEALLEQLLRRGTTTLMDLGGDARTLAVLARDARVGRIVSPDVYYVAVFFGPAFASDPRVGSSSPLYDPGTAPWALAISEETDLALAIAAARGAGAAGIKLYTDLELPLLERVVNEAHRQNLRVWSHATVWPTPPRGVLAAGTDVLEHAQLLLPEIIGEVLPADSDGWLQTHFARDTLPPPDLLLPLLKEMAGKGVSLGTTLHTAHWYTDHPGEGWTPEALAHRQAWQCGAISAAKEAGVRLVAGTDNDGSVPIQEEMKLLVACGLSPVEAITAATLAPAESIGIASSVGSIEAGKMANLVVLDSDPTEDISNAGAIARVMKLGRWYEPVK